MSAIAEALQIIAKALLAKEGLYSIVAGLLTIVAFLVVNRFVVARKRLSWLILSDSGLQIEPDDVIEGLSKATQKELNDHSIVMLEFRNTGSSDIDVQDFVEPHPRFTFGGRRITSCRVSSGASNNAPVSTIERAIKDQAQRHAPATAAVTPEPALASGSVKTGEQASHWTELTLPPIHLNRGAHFKLVIILRGTTKRVDQVHGLHTGEIRNDTPDPDHKRPSWNTVLRRVALVLTGALVIVLAYFIIRPGESSSCGQGELTLNGSTAFMPIIDRLRQTYQSQCPGVKIKTDKTGSLEGIQDLRTHNSDRSEIGVLSDGPAGDGGVGLEPTAQAVLPYTIIVNQKITLPNNNLTTAQLGRIFSGQARSWAEFGGPDIPITIVGRGAESGTRLIFETYVLKGPETSTLTSRDCRTLNHPDQVPAPVVRCEREATADVLGEVQNLPGAIGYVDAPSAAATSSVRPIAIDGRLPNSLDSLRAGYPFWTVEYLYTNGAPDPNSVLAHFIEYLRGQEAHDALNAAHYPPCIQPDRSFLDLCTVRAEK